MSQHFPVRVDPWRMIASNGAFAGKIPLKSLKRLGSLLANTEGEAGFSMSFARDESRHPVVKLEVQADLVLTCQRCLQPMTLGVKSQAALGLVRGLQEAEQLPEELDPLLLEQEDELLDVAGLVEDELILSVPVAPRHELDCISTSAADPHVAVNKETKKENPFSVLAALKSSPTDL